MELRITSLILSVIIYSAYIIYIVRKYKVQTSVSESCYRLPDKLKFIFTLVIWALAFTMITAGQTLTIFISGGALLFVGAASLFKRSKMEKIVHNIGAGVAVTGSLISMGIDFGLWGLVGYNLILFITLYLISKNSIWWIENLVILSMWICVLLTII